jgi:hypothetical protein
MADRTRDHFTPAEPFCVILGTAGLALSGLGVLPASHAWAWLAVLLAGVLLPYLRERAADARARTEDLRAARDAQDNARLLLRARMDEWDKRLEGVLTPEESRRLRADHNALVQDMGRLRAEVETVAKEQRMREMGDGFMGEVT